MKGRRRDKLEGKKTLPMQNSSDAVGLCMDSKIDVEVFKAKRAFPPTESSQVVESALKQISLKKRREEVEGQEEKKEKEKVVYLDDWTIKLVPGNDGSLWIVVLGAIKDTESIAQSSFIKKRVDAHCVVSKGTTYLLEGKFESSSIAYPGFREATMSRFKSGFPHQWQSIIRSEIRFLQDKENEEVGEIEKSREQNQRKKAHKKKRGKAVKPSSQ